MAFSKFLIRYDWGQPSIPYEELKYWTPGISDYSGGVGLDGQPTITNEEVQNDVPVVLESGEGKLNDLKNTADPRCTWVSDIGWTSS